MFILANLYCLSTSYTFHPKDKTGWVLNVLTLQSVDVVRNTKLLEVCSQKTQILAGRIAEKQIGRPGQCPTKSQSLVQMTGPVCYLIKIKVYS